MKIKRDAFIDVLYVVYIIHVKRLSYYALHVGGLLLEYVSLQCLMCMPPYKRCVPVPLY